MLSAMKWDNPQAFAAHIHSMRLFRQSHTCALQVNEIKCDEPALSEDIRTCRVSLTVSETGGSVIPIGTKDWLALVPMWRMAQRRFSQN